jgi:hypothetical protein
VHLNIAAARSYRATLIPPSVLEADVELKSSQGVLPTIRLKAANTGQAEQFAHYVSGLPVLKVERIEEVFA